jgi:ribose 5-phosphate isomerase B
MKKIYIASDHAGFKLKEKLKKYFSFEDLGPDKYDKEDDYPDFAKKLAKKISKDSIGVLVCGSGHGMNISANKFKGIRATVCWNKISAKYAKEHNNVNVLCIPARLVSEATAKDIIKTWMKTKFADKKRHVRRLNKLKRFEK